MVIALVCLAFPRTWLRYAGSPPRDNTAVSVDTGASGGRFPWWGTAGIVLTAVSWIAAWIRPDFLGALTRYTFTPLWIGFILTLDGFVHKRKGHSMITRSPSGFILLFPVSAIGWWFFEYLNRFVQNWYYTAVAHYGPYEYIVSATFPFATVIPAVFEMTELIGSSKWLQRRYQHLPRLPLPPRGIRPAALVAGFLGLTAAALWPHLFFPALWVAPLFIVIPVLSYMGVPSPTAWMWNGDWRAVIALALGTLCCGFFWEMWNIYSLPKWYYTIPYVGSFRVFEMPVLGYFGYLPFGLECYCFYALAKSCVAAKPFRDLKACDGVIPHLSRAFAETREKDKRCIHDL
ncbi:MAG: hypothetical protein K9N51_12090 [Candidatus Pacebacteria bacterium]|nr:hypothetical protein [Candidatus Paceibacterota bacterium]